MSGKLFLRAEDSPLYGADWGASSGSDLVVFPLLDEAQGHDVALARIQKGHPIPELEGRRASGLMAGGRQTIVHVREVHRFHLPRHLAVMPAQRVVGDPKQPGAK